MGPVSPDSLQIGTLLMTSVSLRNHGFLFLFTRASSVYLHSIPVFWARHPQVSGSVELNTASTLETIPGWGALNTPPRVKRVVASKTEGLQVHGAAAPEQAWETLGA